MVYSTTTYLSLLSRPTDALRWNRATATRDATSYNHVIESERRWENAFGNFHSTVLLTHAWRILSGILLQLRQTYKVDWEQFEAGQMTDEETQKIYCSHPVQTAAIQYCSFIVELYRLTCRFGSSTPRKYRYLWRSHEIFVFVVVNANVKWKGKFE